MTKQELIDEISRIANEYAKKEGDPFYDSAFKAMGKVMDDMNSTNVTYDWVDITVKRLYSCYARWRASEKKKGDERANYSHNLAYRGAMHAFASALRLILPEDSPLLPF